MKKSVLEKIEKVKNRYPDRVAVKYGKTEYSYQQLWNDSDKIAYYIRHEKVTRPVIVYGHKEPMMIAAFLGCAKAGAAYCPVDSSMSKGRVIDIADAVSGEIVLTASSEMTIENEDCKKQKCISIEDILSENVLSKDISFGNETDNDLRNTWSKGDDTFYIIFTSGSTGKPKGVEISADNLAGFTDWSETLGLDSNIEHHIFMNQALFSFDLSVMDLYTSLTTGGTLLCLDKKTQADMSKMMTILKEEPITYWVSTPSFADVCMMEHEFDSEHIKTIRTFFFCGERLTKETAEKLRQRFPDSEIINAYGPTESTVAVTAITITDEMLADDELLPVGIARQGTDIKIDENNSEIIIFGDTVGKGYFEAPEKTLEVFGETERYADMGRMRYYRTGDSGFFKDDMLYCTGRIDLQIKLHGYRIELGDIEANLMTYNPIISAAVVPRKDGERIRNLVAFVVAPELEGVFADSRRIKTHLKDNLPDYMIPKKIIYLDKMPLNQNGKIDRRKLEEMLK